MDAAYETLERPEKPRNLLGGIKRLPTGLWDGLQVGALIGTCTACAALGLSAMGIDIPFVHGNALNFVLGSAALHAVGNAAFDGYNEFKDGLEGKADENPFREAAEKIDHTLAKELTGVHHVPDRTKSYAFDTPNPQTNAVVRAILEQRERQKGGNPEQWREKLAMEQAETGQEHSL